MNWNGLELPDKNMYHVEDDVIIYCGDCREILPQLDVKVDLVLTDPPYGIAYQSAWRIGWQRKDRIQGDEVFPMWIFDELKPNNAMFVFCRWDVMRNLPMPKSFIVWDKCRHSMGDLEHEYGRQWEGIAFYPQIGHAFFNRPKDILTIPCVPPERLTHPNEKPEALISELISHNKGNLILDPFLGSGTTAVCAKKLGRKCIGVEISENYCRIAVERLRQQVFKLDI
jgi:DNA modification methylase